MDFEFSADQELLRDSVHRFLVERAPISTYVRRMIDDDRGTSDDVWQGLAGLGVTGLLVPEEHGGSGMGMTEMGVVLEEMGRAVHPGPFFSSAVAAVSVVLAVGDKDDHAAWLPGLAAGETVGTVALFEPGRRYDWRRPATSAHPQGDTWILDGAKAHVPDGAIASVLFVTAASDGGPGLFAVEHGARGLGTEREPSVDGTRNLAALTLDQVSARRVGNADVTDALASALDRISIGLVVDGVGAAEAAMGSAVEHAKARVQFGRPIGAFQAVQHLCSDMAQALELGRAGAYYGLWAADSGDEAECHRAATMAKAFAGEAFPRIGASAIQVFGGIGFTWEHDAHLFFKRLLSLQQLYGGVEEHLEELASLVLR